MTGLQLQEALNNICEKLSAELLSLTGSTGQVVIDSTDIPAHEKPSKESIMGASFGHRTTSTWESEMFYGYKLHLTSVNTAAGPVPVAARVAPANCSDVDEEIVPKLMKEDCDFHEITLGHKSSYYLMDASYDAGSIHSQALEQKGQAIIKLNLRGRKKTSLDYTDEGIPYCPAGHPMSYYGTDQKKLVNKFRCPKKCGQDVTCKMNAAVKIFMAMLKEYPLRKIPCCFVARTAAAGPGKNFTTAAVPLRGCSPC